MALANRRTHLHALNNFSSSIDMVSFKKNSMSLGLAVFVEKIEIYPSRDTPTFLSLIHAHTPQPGERVQKPEYFQHSVTYIKEKENSIRDARTPQPREIFLIP